MPPSSSTTTPPRRTLRSLVDFQDCSGDDLRLALMNMSVQTREDVDDVREGMVEEYSGDGGGDQDHRMSCTTSSRCTGRDERTGDTHLQERTDSSLEGEPRLDADWDWTLTEYDQGRSHPQQITHEIHRLQCVQSFDMIERMDDPTTAGTQATLDRLAGMAQRLFQVPICTINLMDIGRAYIVSGVGVGDIKESSRKETWCNHTMQYKDKLMVVADATKDWRFCHSEHVTGPFHLRFYAGTPMLSPEGYRLGTFCIMGCESKPNGLTPEETATFLDFGRLAAQALMGRRELMTSRIAIERSQQIVEAAAQDSKGLLQSIQYCIKPLQKDPMVSSEAKKNLSTATVAADMVQDINETTLEAVKQEVSSSGPCAVTRNPRNNHSDTHISTASSCFSPAQAQQQEPISDKLHVRETLERLHHLMDPMPKKSPIVFSLDPTLPASIMTHDAKKLQRSCLHLLQMACTARAKGPIQFRIARREPHQVAFECRYYGANTSTRTGTVSSTLDTTINPNRTYGGRIFGSRRHHHHYSQGTNSKEQDCLLHRQLGLWPLVSHVEDLGGAYGYQFAPQQTFGTTNAPGNSTSQQEGNLVWFSVPLVLGPDCTPPVTPLVQDQQPKQTRTKKRRDSESGSSDTPIRPLVRLLHSDISQSSNTPAPPVVVRLSSSAPSSLLLRKHARRDPGFNRQDSNSSTLLARQDEILMKQQQQLQVDAHQSLPGRKRIKLSSNAIAAATPAATASSRDSCA